MTSSAVADLASIIDSSNVFCLNSKSTHPVANLFNPGSAPVCGLTVSLRLP
jgi:hypothetical protein